MPVPVTFGITNPAGANDSTDTGYLNGSPVTLPATGTLTSLSVYVGQIAPGSKIRLALYAAGSANKPGNLIAQTGEAIAAVGWDTLPIGSPPMVTAGTYWIAAQTNDPSTVYRLSDMATPSDVTAWFPFSYGPFPTTTGTWATQSGSVFAMAGTVMTVPGGEVVTPIPGTSTSTPTPTRTATPPSAPTSTPTSGPVPTPTMGSGSFDATCAGKLNPAGITQCGDPRFFCDSWTGGFCNDYRTKQTTMEQPFPQPGDAVSLDCLSSTNAGQISTLPYYITTNNSGNMDVPGAELIPFPCGISMYEHFMTRMEDGQFGMVVMRQQHPFDFAGRTGHLHFDVDLKTTERRYMRLTLSPNLTKVGVDDRNRQPQASQAFDLWFRNGTFQGELSQGGNVTDLFPSCNGCGARYYGQDNVRDHVDVYVSRTHVKVMVNGVTEVDTNIPDMGFDRAYVYLQHVNYNSCKAYQDGEGLPIAECQLAGNTFHWDNVAADGPTLPVNGLTPAGSEDVVFNVWSAASCTVKGVAAQGNGRDSVWQTWVARLPAGTPVSASDVQCSGGSNGGYYHYEGVPMGFEVVQQ